MAHGLDDRSLPLPIRARRLAAQLGRNFAETIHQLIVLDSDAEAVVRHFNELDAEEERKAARRHRRPRRSQRGGQDDVDALVEQEDEGINSERDHLLKPEPEPVAPEIESIFICKSESEPIIVAPPNGATVIDEMVLRGVLAPAMIVTARGARTVYASPSFAKYLSAACGEE